jgi:ElaB/YqjD/DUF883 family membrane-anchored ribosome-binding protein
MSMAEKTSDAAPKKAATPKATAAAKTAAATSTAKPRTRTTATAAPATAAVDNIVNEAAAGAGNSAGGESFREQASAFKGKASDKAREYADTGKDKAADLLDSLSKTVKDLAGSVDERLGTTYGDYTRKAADVVSGAADSLKAKDVDDIVADTREFVRTRPAVAIGAAAAVGFLLARLVKAGTGGDREDS